MSYASYTTKALVCGTFDRNTADRSYLLFTREAGMLYASARSVREERSRQRYSLQDFSLVRVSLIKGKAGWRIGSIESARNYYQIAVNKSARFSIVSIFRLLRRFVKGEEVATGLFDYVVEALDQLVGDIDTRSFVLLSVQVQIMNLLGYVDAEEVPKTIRTLPPKAIAAQYSSKIEKQIKEIYTHAISVSHL